MYLWAFLCVSKSTHSNILNASSVVAFLSIMCAALFCRRCKLLPIRLRFFLFWHLVFELLKKNFRL